jgi:hypothetical protein
MMIDPGRNSTKVESYSRIFFINNIPKVSPPGEPPILIILFPALELSHSP